MSVRLAACALVGMVLFTGCGGGHGSNADSCDGAPLSAEGIRLPADFPIPSEVVLTASTKIQANQVVDGYFSGGIEAGYHDWKKAFEGAGYSILFDELEQQSSAIAYLSANQRSTGQITLRDDCAVHGRTFVHVTNRPV
jgi:hypothetical protein